MSTSTIIAIVLIVAVVLLLASLVAVTARKRRTSRLRDHFGPEYDRTLDETGKRRDAESELLSRKQEHEQLQLRPLTAAAQQRFIDAWTSVQTRFVDTPALALTEADTLVTQLLTERGYPVDDFDTKSRLLSVEHADVIDSYRNAHQVEVASRARTADTETVRNAFLDFRRVFDNVMADMTGDNVTRQGSSSATDAMGQSAPSDDPYPHRTSGAGTEGLPGRRGRELGSGVAEQRRAE